MERLIDATRIEQYILNNCSDNEEINAIYAEIINAPTVDPVKQGYWIAHDMSIKDVPTEACSECGEWSYGYNEPYCPNCGAKMDEVEK